MINCFIICVVQLINLENVHCLAHFLLWWYFSISHTVIAQCIFSTPEHHNHGYNGRYACIYVSCTHTLYNRADLCSQVELDRLKMKERRLFNFCYSLVYTKTMVSRDVFGLVIRWRWRLCGFKSLRTYLGWVLCCITYMGVSGPSIYTYRVYRLYMYDTVQ